MAAITDVTLVAGAPTAGTGTVTTLDKFNGTAGSSTTQALTVQGITAGTAMPVSLASVPSHAVTNAGTFAVQVSSAPSTAVTNAGTFAVQSATTLAAETTKVIGTVNVASSQTIAVTNAGTFATQSTLAAETTKNIGTIRVGDGTNTATVKAASSGAAPTTDTALVVTLRDTNANGQALMTNSAPVTLPSDTNGPYSATANFVSNAITTAMTGTTSTSLLAAPGASLRNYITTIIVSNAHATVGTDVVIQDGSGGTTLLTIPAAAVYGGAVITLPTPLKQPTTNTAIFCANVTTGASTKVSAVGYKGA